MVYIQLKKTVLYPLSVIEIIIYYPDYDGICQECEIELFLTRCHKCHIDGGKIKCDKGSIMTGCTYFSKLSSCERCSVKDDELRCDKCKEYSDYYSQYYIT